MVKTAHIVIGCVGLVAAAFVIIVCVIVGIFYLGLSSDVDKTEAAGLEYGKSSDQRGCQQESLRRLRTALKSHDIVKRREAQIFAYGCFETCRATTEFCVDAPKEDDFFVINKWAQDQCQKEGFGSDDACLSVFAEVADACLGRTRHK